MDLFLAISQGIGTSLATGVRAAVGTPGFEASASVQPATPTSPARSREAASRLAALLSDSDPAAGEFI